MQKKGQLTIFIILGIIILLIIGGIFYFVPKEIKNKETPRIIETESIKSYIKQCIYSTAQKAILENGRRGGYFLLPKHSTTDLFENLPYYLDSEQSMFPSNEVFAEESGEYIDTMLDLCLNDFEYFKEQGYNIDFQNSSSKVTLNSQKLIIETTLPLKITLGEQTKEISIFKTDVPAKQFYQNIIVAKEIIQSQEGEEVCLTCFSSLAQENDLFVAVLSHHNNTYIFDITDNNYLIGEEKYHLIFAVKYE